MDRTTNFIMAIVLSVSLALSGCAGKSAQQGTKAFVGAQETMVSLFVAADQACTAGMLNQTQCDKIAAAYNKAKPAYDAAATAMQSAIRAGEAGGDDTAAWERFRALEKEFNPIYLELVNLALSFGVDFEQK